jgi:hypothetical protein
MELWTNRQNAECMRVYTSELTNPRCFTFYELVEFRYLVWDSKGFEDSSLGMAGPRDFAGAQGWNVDRNNGQLMLRVAVLCSPVFGVR